MKKKKLLFVIWTYSWGGGAENILTNLVNHLDPNKYEIDILEYFHFNIKKEPVNDNINVLPPIVDVNHTNKIDKFYKMFLVKHNPSILRRKYTYKKYDYEIAFTKMIPSFLLDYSRKTIIWLHGQISNETDKKSDIKLQDKYFRKVDKVIMISKYNEEVMTNMFPVLKDKTVTIYNSFNFDLIDKKSKEEKLPKSSVPILLSLGRLDEVKNPLMLLEVAKKLKEKKIKFKLQYIGHGSLMEELKRKIITLDLEDEVEVLGFKENPYPYVKNSTLLVQTSKHEGFPTVFAEGLYFGKPFVCTKVGGAEELSDNNQCGYVIDNMDINLFTEKVISLLEDKKLYNNFSEHGRENVNQFTIDKQISSFEELLDSIK